MKNRVWVRIVCLGLAALMLLSVISTLIWSFI